MKKCPCCPAYKAPTSDTNIATLPYMNYVLTQYYSDHIAPLDAVSMSNIKMAAVPSAYKALV